MSDNWISETDVQTCGWCRRHPSQVSDWRFCATGKGRVPGAKTYQMKCECGFSSPVFSCSQEARRAWNEMQKGVPEHAGVPR